MAEQDKAEYHEGAIVDAHKLDQGIRGGQTMMHEPSEEGETATIRCGTTKGDFVAVFHRDWSPNGYDKATALFQKGFMDHSHFFRAVPKFLVQFGISYSTDKALQQFANKNIPDDPQLDPPIKFHKGTMAFAGELVLATWCFPCFVGLALLMLPLVPNNPKRK
jgi:Cyclophilin type peptidyl-prolyl cis-trans isomerase/CLD